MERKITKRLEQWAAEETKKPLVVFGARQIGKSTSILEFGHQHYQQVIEVNFYEQPTLKAAFKTSLKPEDILLTLEAMLNIDIDPEHDLLFFDEIQESDEALTSLKFFCTTSHNYNVIAAGSMLGVHVAGKGSFPVGYVDILRMYPMDFEEFCWATDKRKAFDLVRHSFENFSECPVHEIILEAYHNYLLVGGMPEAVAAHAEGKKLGAVRKIQRDILDGYVVDIAKYATAVDSAKILATWDSLPAQLAKESGSTKFMWRYIANGAKAERYESALDWLIAAGVVNKCSQISEGVAPLTSFVNPSSFKIYVGDTGLLSCRYDAIPSDFEQTDHRSARFRGGMAENYVMQQLVASGFTPYYWGQQSTNEVEFVVRLQEGIVPLEVKSGSRVSSTSAKNFAKKYGCPFIVHITEKNFGKTDNVRSIPLYAACLLKNPFEEDSFS